jgi:uncharacterized protein (DUF2147 family)
MRTTAIIAGIGLTAVSGDDRARAADSTGTWRTEGGKATVRIGKCGGDALCGTIVALQEQNDPASGRPKTDKKNVYASKRSRPVVGVPIVLGMKPSGADKWSGKVYNAEDGKTYSGHLTLTGPYSLKLEGCALGGMICRAQTWTKAN